MLLFKYWLFFRTAMMDAEDGEEEEEIIEEVII